MPEFWSIQPQFAIAILGRVGLLGHTDKPGRGLLPLNWSFRRRASLPRTMDRGLPTRGTPATRQRQRPNNLDHLTARVPVVPSFGDKSPTTFPRMQARCVWIRLCVQCGIGWGTGLAPYTVRAQYPRVRDMAKILLT